MTKKSLPSLFLIIYGLFFLMAVILRFNQLNTPLLSEREASIALQSEFISPTSTATGSGVSGYSSLLGSILFIFGKSEFTARLLSAFFGILLILAPLLFQYIIGKETAFILSLLIMFDPGFVAFSRQVDGAMITLAGFCLAMGLLLNKKPVWSGVALGFAFLGSPILWPGIIALSFSAWIVFSRVEEPEELKLSFAKLLPSDKSDWLNLIIAVIVTIVLLGSTILTRLSGLAAPVLNLTAYLRGWLSSDELPISLYLFSFLLYQPFIFFFGLFEGIKKSFIKDLLSTFLLWWFVLSLLLAVIFPSRSMAYLLFSYIPLLTLASRFIWNILQSMERPEIPALGEMVMVVMLVVFSWMNLIVLKFPIEGQESILRAVAAVGSLVLLLVASLLIRMGWPPKQAGTGFWMGTAILVAIFSFTSAWRAAGLGLHPQAELWNYAGITDEVDLLRRTAGDLSEWNINTRESINIVILDQPSAALRWGLRNFTSVKEDKALPNLSNPAIVITRDEQIPALANAYRGQDFSLIRKTSWSLIMPTEWIKWYAFRELPSETEQVILWARTDLFPGAANTAPATINPIQ